MARGFSVVVSLPAFFLSTSSAVLHLGIKKEEGKEIWLAWSTEKDMEPKLPLAFSCLLSCEKMEVKNFASFVVDVGPGSFTGIRLGLSFLKGVTAWHEPLFFALSSLDVLALSEQEREGSFAVLRDARKERVYCCCYERKRKGEHFYVKRKGKPQLLALAAFEQRVSPKISFALTDEAGLKKKLSSSFPLFLRDFRPSPQVFSWPVTPLDRLQLQPLYLQSFP